MPIIFLGGWEIFPGVELPVCEILALVLPGGGEASKGSTLEVGECGVDLISDSRVCTTVQYDIDFGSYSRLSDYYDSNIEKIHHEEE